MSAISVVKRSGGGYSITFDGVTKHVSKLDYTSNKQGVLIKYESNDTSEFVTRPASDWTINEVTGFTTVTQVCDALDALGVISQKTQLLDHSGNPYSKPDLVDTTSETVVYEGYKSGAAYKICKLDASTAIFARTWATGAWADRATLNYV